MAIFAKHRASDFRLKRNVVVFAAMVADDFKAGRRIFPARRFFRATFLASLRRHHISLIKSLLFLFPEKKRFLALHTRNFYVGHRFFLLVELCGKFNRKILNVATISRSRRRPNFVLLIITNQGIHHRIVRSGM